MQNRLRAGLKAKDRSLTKASWGQNFPTLTTF